MTEKDLDILADKIAERILFQPRWLKLKQASQYSTIAIGYNVMDMRLYKRGKFYYIELSRGKSKSLGVTTEREAERLFREIKKRQLEKKLMTLDEKERVSLSRFIEIYLSDPDRVNLSEKTLVADGLALRNLKDVLGDIPIRLIDRESIKKFKTASLKRIKARSVNTYLGHIRTALRWAANEDYINKVPQIKKIKLGRTMPRYLPLEDVKKITDYSKKHEPEMYRVIRDTGEILIYGKGNKERLVPLFPDALEEKKDIGKIFRYVSGSTISNYFRKIVRTGWRAGPVP